MSYVRTLCASRCHFDVCRCAKCHHAKCRGAYLCRQIEGENGEIENADAGDDEVDHEEERLPPDLQVEVDI